MKLNNLILRCYIKKTDDQFVATCIDLSLSAQSDTMDDAKIKLESMINTYINEAFTVHKEYADQLLSRKSPISQILEYYCIRVLVNVFKLKNDISIFFETPPLKLA